MTKIACAKWAAGLLCALLIGGAVACSSGGGDSGGGSPPAATPPPVPPQPPAPPPGTLQPTLYIEKDADGTTYIRVEEQTYDVFYPTGPQRTIANRTLGPSPGSNFEIEGPETTFVSNVDIVRMKHGFTLLGSALVSIYDYTYNDFDGDTSIHGAAIKLGDNSRPTNGATFIQRVFADGRETPDPSYQISNTDFIGIEYESGPIYVRDVTGRNFGDGGVDSKSGPMYVMNATLSGVHRGLRAWWNTEITIANSIVNAPPGQSHVWIKDNTATVRYFNTLWCENAANPTPSDPNCSMTPTIIEGEDISNTAAVSRVIALSDNPLPATHDFFRTRMDKIAVQYSTDGTVTWQNLALSNVGENGVAPLGDPRYRIPLNLNDNFYWFRAWYENDGAPVGAISATIYEDGQVVP